MNLFLEQSSHVIHVWGRVQSDGLHRQDRAISEQEVRFFAQNFKIPLNILYNQVRVCVGKLSSIQPGANGDGQVSFDNVKCKYVIF